MYIKNMTNNSNQYVPYSFELFLKNTWNEHKNLNEQNKNSSNEKDSSIKQKITSNEQKSIIDTKKI